MKNACLLNLLLLITLVLAPSLTANAKAPVWKVSKGENHLYLGGTIHVLSRADYPLPQAFDKVFSQAEEVVFETDVAAISSPEVQTKLLAAMQFQDGRTLEDVLQKDTWKKLEAFLSARSLQIDQFAAFTPAGVSMTLLVIELQRLGLMDAPGVDSYFAQRANFEGKDIAYLESIDEQIGFIKDMNNEDGDQTILSTIRDVDELSGAWDKILSAWRSGDMQALHEIGNVPMQKEFPDMYQFLLVERNQKWLSKISAMMIDPDVEFILVGSLHMAGEDGLIHELQQSGYTIEQLD